MSSATDLGAQPPDKEQLELFKIRAKLRKPKPNETRFSRIFGNQRVCSRGLA